MQFKSFLFGDPKYSIKPLCSNQILYQATMLQSNTLSSHYAAIKIKKLNQQSKTFLRVLEVVQYLYLIEIIKNHYRVTSVNGYKWI